MILDWAYGRPTVGAMQSMGVKGVARYLTRSAPKALTASEVDRYRSGGLAIHAVFEDAVGRPVLGFNAGVSDAAHARDQAMALGWNYDGAIYFAVDMYATYDQVVDYFRGVNSVLPAAVVGCYGGTLVYEPLREHGWINYAWQAAAMYWSNYRIGKCDMLQLVKQTTVEGITVDINEARSNDTGAWFGGVAMAVSDELRAVLNEGTAQGQTSWAGTSRETLGGVQRTFNAAVDANTNAWLATQVGNQVSGKVDSLSAKVDALLQRESVPAVIDYQQLAYALLVAIQQGDVS